MFINLNLNNGFIDAFIIEYVAIKNLPYPIEICRKQESKIRDGMGVADHIMSRASVVGLMLGELFPYLNDDDYTVFYVRHESLDQYFILKDGFLELVDNTRFKVTYQGMKYGM